VNVRYPVLAAILLYYATAHAETPAPATNTLDAAKRDLRELPAVERSKDILGKSSGIGSAGLPTLTLPGEGSTPQNKPEPNAPPSPTWLQDALNQTDADRGQRRPGRDSTLARDPANGYKPTHATDPLAQYLGQWMTPRDRELLRPEAGKDGSDQKSKGPLDQTGPASELSGVTALQTGLLQEPAKNPYLQEPEPLPLAPNPFAPAVTTNAGANERSRLPAPLPAANPDRPTSLPSSPNPVVAPLAPAAPSPAAPIVDDRKYFPQLRRF